MYPIDSNLNVQAALPLETTPVAAQKEPVNRVRPSQTTLKTSFLNPTPAAANAAINKSFAFSVSPSRVQVNSQSSKIQSLKSTTSRSIPAWVKPVAYTALAVGGIALLLFAYESGGTNQEAGSPLKKPEAPAKELEAQIKKPEAQIKKPEAPAKELEAQIKKPEAPAKELEAQIKKPEAPAKELEAQIKKPEAPAKELEAQSQEAGRTDQSTFNSSLYNPNNLPSILKMAPESPWLHSVSSSGGGFNIPQPPSGKSQGIIQTTLDVLSSVDITQLLSRKSEKGLFSIARKEIQRESSGMCSTHPMALLGCFLFSSASITGEYFYTLFSDVRDEPVSVPSAACALGSLYLGSKGNDFDGRLIRAGIGCTTGVLLVDTLHGVLSGISSIPRYVYPMNPRSLP